jgi:hypothetical protein
VSRPLAGVASSSESIQGGCDKERVIGSGKATGTLERIRFGEFLVERKVIDDGQLLDALAEHWAGAGRMKIGAAITQRGILPTETVEQWAAEYHALQVIEVVGVPRSAMS